MLTHSTQFCLWRKFDDLTRRCSGLPQSLCFDFELRVLNADQGGLFGNAVSTLPSCVPSLSSRHVFDLDDFSRTSIDLFHDRKTTCVRRRVAS